MEVTKEKLLQIENLVRELLGKDVETFMGLSIPCPKDPKRCEMAILKKGSPSFLAEVTMQLLDGSGAQVIKIPMDKMPKDIFPKPNPKYVN